MNKPLRRIMLMVLPAGALIGLSVAAAVTHVLPKIYESEALIEPASRIHSEGGTSPEDRRRVLVDLKKNDHLSTVADKLLLPRKWDVDKSAAVRILTRIVSVGYLGESDLVFIRVRHAEKEDARDIASEVVAVYEKSRADEESALLEKVFSETRATIADLEGKVSASRQILEELGDTTTRNVTVDGTETLLHIAPSEKRSNARRDFESSEAALAAFRAKLIDQIPTCIKCGHEGIVIHEDPQLARSPVSPNVPLNLVLGGVAGALLSPLLAMVGMGLMDLLKSRRREVPESRFS